MKLTIKPGAQYPWLYSNSLCHYGAISLHNLKVVCVYQWISICIPLNQWRPMNNLWEMVTQSTTLAQRVYIYVYMYWTPEPQYIKTWSQWIHPHQCPQTYSQPCEGSTEAALSLLKHCEVPPVIWGHTSQHPVIISKCDQGCSSSWIIEVSELYFIVLYYTLHVV